jgi:hypothetical protein
MTTLNAPHHETPTRLDALRARFAALARQVRLRLAVEGTARALWVAVALLIVGAWLDHGLELSAWVRAGWLLVTAAAAGHFVYHDLLKPLRLPMGPVELAAALDRREHVPRGRELSPRIASVFQLGALHGGIDRPSPAMIDLAVRRGLDALGELDLASHLDQQRFLRHGLSLVAAVLLPILLWAAFAPLGGVWASRWLTLSPTPWPRNTMITVLDADEQNRITVPRGEPFLLRLKVADKPGTGPTDTVTMRVRRDRGKRETITLDRFAPGDFRHDFGPVQQPLTLRFAAGDGKAGPVEILPADRPRIVDLELVAKHPRDEQPTVRHFGAGDGDLALRPDTDATLRLSANVPVAEARLLEGADDVGAFERLDEKSFALRWTHQRAVRLRVELIGRRAQLGSYPIPLTIGLRADRPPRVSLRREGVQSRVTPTATLPLRITATDDEAVRAVRLAIVRQAPTRAEREAAAAAREAEHRRRVREAEAAGEDPPVFEDEDDAPAADHPPPVLEPITLFGPADPATDKSLELSHDLSLATYEPAVGDLVRLTAVARDNRYGGPQEGRSRVLVFRITAPDELFRQILQRQQSLRSRFRQARLEAEELRDAMNVYTTERAQAKELLNQHRLTQRTVWQVRRALDASAEEMRLNNLGGEESYELLRRYVLEPMGRLHDQTMTRQRQALDALGEDDAEPIDALITRQEAIMADMDAILKAMNQWDSFIDVVNQLNEIIKLQAEVRKFTEALEEEATDGLFED